MIPWVNEQQVALGFGLGVAVSTKPGRRFLFRRAPGLLWKSSNVFRVGSASTSIGLGSLATSVAAGYVVGAAVGTGISYSVWGEKGARDAFDFYSGQADYSEYFDIPGNVRSIVSNS